jgi:uncharacterized LabA/DUF88 family protein
VADTDTAVGIYWDFENAHACLIDETQGEGTYRSAARFKVQEAVVDIARVAGYAASFGRVSVHRAYANWQYFIKYKDELHAHAIDLVQLFPLTGTKNGADIRLVLDVAEDLERQPWITHVVVVGSDSDFTALAQRCRAYGRHFIGIGTARNVARGYPNACDTFIRYQDLPAGSRAVAEPAGSGQGTGDAAPGPEAIERAAGLVSAAVRRLAAVGGGPWVLKAAVRPMMRKLDAEFDETALGFAGFADLVNALSERIAERPGRYDHELAVRADLPGAGPCPAVPAARSRDGDVTAAPEGPDPAGPPTPVSLAEWQLKKSPADLVAG